MLNIKGEDKKYQWESDFLVTSLLALSADVTAIHFQFFLATMY